RCVGSGDRLLIGRRRRSYMRTPRRVRPIARRWTPLVALALMVLAANWLFANPFNGTAARFTDTQAVGSNTFTTDTLNAPTGLTAIGGAAVALTWTATSDTYASGHRIFRASTTGGPYTQIAQVTPRTTVNYTDTPSGGTYY